MIKRETTIIIPERNDPLLRLRFWVVDESVNPPVRTPYDLTNSQQIEFIVKSGVATDDSDATVVYTLSGGAIQIVSPATDGQITVQVLAADLATLKTGSFRFRVDVVKNGLRDTLMAGPFVIKNL